MQVGQQQTVRLGAAEYVWLGVGAAFMVGLAALLYVNRPRARSR
jgi:hypothetical protein